MHIETQGSGPDLVLVHGWAMHGGVFAPLLERLAAHFRVHVVDLPGHGFARAEQHFDAQDSARRIAAETPRFVRAADWPDAVGAEVFAEFAAELRLRYRHAIERFLALETMGSPHAQAELRDLRQRVFARGEPRMEALCDGLAALESGDLRAALPSLAMPSLWIAGRRDRLVPPAAMHRAAGLVPAGRYLEFNSGHAPFIEHASGVADALVEFERGLPA